MRDVEGLTVQWAIKHKGAARGDKAATSRHYTWGVRYSPISIGGG